MPLQFGLKMLRFMEQKESDIPGTVITVCALELRAVCSGFVQTFIWFVYVDFSYTLFCFLTSSSVLVFLFSNIGTKIMSSGVGILGRP